METYTNTTIKEKLLNADIEFDLLSYPKGIRDTQIVAQKLNIPTSWLYKSLVVIIDGKPNLIVLPSDNFLNLDQLTNQLGNKVINVATREEAEKYTGMQVGGISPFGVDRNIIQIHVNESILDLKHIYVSAGQRGFVMKVSVIDCISFLKPVILRLN